MEILTQFEGRPKPAPALAQLLERRVFAPARAIGEELSLVAITDAPPPVSITQQSDGRTWIAARHDHDPVAIARGGLNAPEAEIERFARMHRAGVRFDLILVGHELAGHWQPGDPVPSAYLPDEQATVAQVTAIQSATLAAGWQWLREIAGLALGAGAATVAAAGALGVAGAALHLDPFVLGGVRDPKTGRIAWVYLGGWDESPGPA